MFTRRVANTNQAQEGNFSSLSTKCMAQRLLFAEPTHRSAQAAEGGCMMRSSPANSSPKNAMTFAVNQLMRKIVVANDPQSYLLSVAVTAANPERAAWLANAVAIEYLRGQLLQRLTEAFAGAEHETAELSSV
jgi:hypothetical protein